MRLPADSFCKKKEINFEFEGADRSYGTVFILKPPAFSTSSIEG